jgi:hypothetical protein
MPQSRKINKHKQKLIQNMRKNQERINLDAQGNKIGKSTVLMRAEIGEAIGGTSGEWYSFPTLFPHNVKPNRWIDYSKDIRGAFIEAQKRNEVFKFGKDKKSAIKFSKGSWKK